MELTFDTYMEVTRLMNMQIGRNEYRLEQLPNGIARDRLLEQTKEFDEAVIRLSNEFWGFDSEGAADEAVEV